MTPLNEPQYAVNAPQRQPWERGPWHVEKELMGFDIYDASLDNNFATVFGRETAELIALAPEMAEAILAQFEYVSDEAVRLRAKAAVWTTQHDRRAAQIALKLRAIGGAS